MDKTISKTVKFCDVCKEEAGFVHICLKCGMEHCWNCFKLRMIEYAHAVSFSGTGDGYYCKTCDAELKELGLPDPLHKAYWKIKLLRSEHKIIWKEIGQQSKEAESQLKTLLSQ